MFPSPVPSRTVSGGIKGSAVLVGTAGLYLVYIGVKDVPFMDGLRDILRQKRPTPREAHLAYVPKIAKAVAAVPGGGSATAVGSFLPSEMVSVGGIRVHKSIGGELSRMITAARGDGIVLTGSGYRSSLEQAALRKKNHCTCDNDSDCCSPPTAPVGQSMHERGLAIDFNNCRDTSTRVYKWLAAHAAEYGFHNLPGEPWHWSTNGK